MKKEYIVVALVTLFAIFYQVAPYVSISDKYILYMFIISPFLVVYMVYTILKYGKPSGNSFDERFYDDLDGKE